MRFTAMLGSLLAVPAAVYLLVGALGGGMHLAGLLPNYLYMATPHLLVGMLAFWPAARCSATLLVLSLLDVLLIVFQLWIVLVVPAHESGLAWVLYIPLWGAVLMISATAWAVSWRRRVRASGAS